MGSVPGSVPARFISVIPPGTIGERAQIELVRPARSMLLREVKVCFRDPLGKQQSVVFVAPGFPQQLKSFRPEHLAQSIGCVDGAVDDDVYDMDSLRGELRIERLAEHSSTTHGGRMRMLPAVSPP